MTQEEGDLAARFGPTYAAYRVAVRCWVPRWPPHPGGVYETSGDAPPR